MPLCEKGPERDGRGEGGSGGPAGCRATASSQPQPGHLPAEAAPMEGTGNARAVGRDVGGDAADRECRSRGGMSTSLRGWRYWGADVA